MNTLAKVLVFSAIIVALSLVLPAPVAFWVIWLAVGLIGTKRLFPDMFTWKKPDDIVEVVVRVFGTTIGAVLGFATFWAAE